MLIDMVKCEIQEERDKLWVVCNTSNCEYNDSSIGSGELGQNFVLYVKNLMNCQIVIALSWS